MFNFKKRASFAPVESAEDMVAKIHNEIDTAADRLLEEANKIINPQIIDRAVRLRNAGFTGANMVTNSIRLVKSKELSELILYYKQTYPFHKFLTEAELNRICLKYNLIFAPVSKYKEDVPDKNLEDIENMPPLKDSDIQPDYYLYEYTDSYDKNLTEDEAKELKLGIRVDASQLRESADRILTKHFNRPISMTYSLINNRFTLISKSGLFIAAPKSHFNLSGLKKEGLGFMSFTTIPKDPIVFRYVRGGIQIITKWGLEASDENVINEIHN